MKKLLSICVLSKNEGKNVDYFMESIKGIDVDILVFDESSDNSRERWERYKVKMLQERKTGETIEEKRNIFKPRTEWAMHLDTDEIPSSKLEDVLELAKLPNLDSLLLETRHFYNEKSYFHYGYWAPYKSVRAFRTKLNPGWWGLHSPPKFKINPKYASGAPITVINHHYYRTARTWGDIIKKHIKYSGQERKQRGREPGYLEMLMAFWAYSIYGLIIKSAWKDGIEGLKANDMLSAYFASSSGLSKRKPIERLDSISIFDLEYFSPAGC